MATKKPVVEKTAKRPPPKKPGTRNRDWTPLRDEYVTGDISLPELAKKHGASESTVRKQCAAGKWPEARESFRDELGAETRRKIAAKYAAGKVRDFERLEMAADRLSAEIESGELAANSLDAATKALIETTKAKAALAGDPVTEKKEVNVTGNLDVAHHGLEDMTYDELIALRASVAVGTGKGTGKARPARRGRAG
jgi:hypothetical protein